MKSNRPPELIAMQLKIDEDVKTFLSFGGKITVLKPMSFSFDAADSSVFSHSSTCQRKRGAKNAHKTIK